MHRRIEVTFLGYLGSCGRNVWNSSHANFGMSCITTLNFPVQKGYHWVSLFLFLQLFRCVSSFPVLFFPCGPLNCGLTGGSCWKGKSDSFKRVISTANCLSLLNAEEQSFTMEIVEVLTFFPFFSKHRCQNTFFICSLLFLSLREIINQ